MELQLLATAAAVHTNNLELQERAALAIEQQQQQQQHHHHDIHHHDEQQKMMMMSYYRMRGKKPPLSLETYLSFVSSRDIHALNVEHINHIISIHGYKKLKIKKHAEEAVKAITQPVDPSRSTLNNNNTILNSKRSFVTLQEAMKDLVALGWQECSVTSIRSINASNYSPTAAVTATPAASIGAGPEKLPALLQWPNPKTKKRSRQTKPAAKMICFGEGVGEERNGGGSGSGSKSVSDEGSCVSKVGRGEGESTGGRQPFFGKRKSAARQLFSG